MNLEDGMEMSIMLLIGLSLHEMLMLLMGDCAIRSFGDTLESHGALLHPINHHSDTNRRT